jgi:hypothetical protein
LLLLIVLPLRAQGCNNSAAFKFLARRFKLIFDQKNCATSRPYLDCSWTYVMKSFHYCDAI